jgi:hypothetical protein
VVRCIACIVRVIKLIVLVAWWCDCGAMVVRGWLVGWWWCTLLQAKKSPYQGAYSKLRHKA